MQWDLEAFRLKVKSKLSKVAYECFCEAIDSFAWKKLITAYHLDEFRRIFRNHFGTDRQQIKASQAASVADIVVNARHAESMYCEAHLIAAAQSLHSMHDILANAMFWALKLDTFPHSSDPKKNEKKLTKIIRNLSFANIVSLHPSAVPPVLTKKIADVIQNSSYLYLLAFVNRTKHTSLVRGAATVDFLDDRGGFQFSEFKYHDVLYPAKWSNEFDDLLGECWVQIADVGMSFDNVV